MPIAEAKSEYLEWLKSGRGLSAHTVRAYGGDITEFERFVGEASDLVQVNKSSLEAFFQEQRKDGLSTASLRRRMAGLRGFSNGCWTVG